VLDIDGLKPREKLVLLALAARAGTDGRAWPSVPRIAADTGYSERSVQYALRNLVKSKHVNVIHRPGTSSLLMLGGANFAPLGVQISHPGVQISTKRGADIAPRRERNRSRSASPAPTPPGAGAAANGNGSIAAQTAAVQRRRAEAANCGKCDDEGVTLDGDGWCKH
jgi:hypothetical protein